MLQTSNHRIKIANKQESAETDTKNQGNKSRLNLAFHKMYEYSINNMKQQLLKEVEQFKDKYLYDEEKRIQAIERRYQTDLDTQQKSFAEQMEQFQIVQHQALLTIRKEFEEKSKNFKTTIENQYLEKENNLKIDFGTKYEKDINRIKVEKESEIERVLNDSIMKCKVLEEKYLKDKLETIENLKKYHSLEISEKNKEIEIYIQEITREIAESNEMERELMKNEIERKYQVEIQMRQSDSRKEIEKIKSEYEERIKTLNNEINHLKEVIQDMEIEKEAFSQYYNKECKGMLQKNDIDLKNKIDDIKKNYQAAEESLRKQITENFEKEMKYKLDEQERNYQTKRELELSTLRTNYDLRIESMQKTIDFFNENKKNDNISSIKNLYDIREKNIEAELENTKFKNNELISYIEKLKEEKKVNDTMISKNSKQLVDLESSRYDKIIKDFESTISEKDDSLLKMREGTTKVKNRIQNKE